MRIVATIIMVFFTTGHLATCIRTANKNTVGIDTATLVTIMAMDFVVFWTIWT